MKSSEQVFLLGGGKLPHPAIRVRTKEDVRLAIVAALKLRPYWIAVGSKSTDMLIEEAFAVRNGGLKQKLGNLLMTYTPAIERLPALQDLFTSVSYVTPYGKALSVEELAEVFTSENPADLFVAGFHDAATQTLNLVRGDCRNLIVPLSIFKSSGKSPKIEPDKFDLADCGQTVKLGDYEASAEAILYEADPAYRRRVNSRRREEEKSFGASLRRLRISRRLTQDDFGDLPAKTILRLEKGITQKPHGETLRKIAGVLNVEPDEIETY